MRGACTKPRSRCCPRACLIQNSTRYFDLYAHPKPMTNLQFLLLRLARSLEGRLGCVARSLRFVQCVVQPNAFLIGFDFVFFPVTRIFEKLAPNESATVASEPNPKPESFHQQQ